MNAERMKTKLNQVIDMEQIALALIKGRYNVVETEERHSLDCEHSFEAVISLPDGTCMTLKKEGWGF
ncbi:TPA: hypothetical protein QCN48_005106 [Bacillus toyonensis]|nr:hypothetical protein [Bacillus toyonensis]